MSRHPKPLVSTSTYNFPTYNDNQVQFLDGCGDIDLQTMMWLYYISSVMILNIDQNDRSGNEKDFLKHL